MIKTQRQDDYVCADGWMGVYMSRDLCSEVELRLTCYELLVRIADSDENGFMYNKPNSFFFFFKLRNYIIS